MLSSALAREGVCARFSKHYRKGVEECKKNGKKRTRLRRSYAYRARLHIHSVYSGVRRSPLLDCSLLRSLNGLTHFHGTLTFLLEMPQVWNYHPISLHVYQLATTAAPIPRMVEVSRSVDTLEIACDRTCVGEIQPSGAWLWPRKRPYLSQILAACLPLVQSSGSPSGTRRRRAANFSRSPLELGGGPNGRIIFWNGQVVACPRTRSVFLISSR